MAGSEEDRKCQELGWEIEEEEGLGREGDEEDGSGDADGQEEEREGDAGGEDC